MNQPTPGSSASGELQLNSQGRLQHLLDIERLILSILDTTRFFISANDREVKKVPLLRGEKG
jgi:aspartate carbamoyltransferase catalytic subunit